MQRRASLSISTNAIVVLIVAVIMLGLIIGFVTQGFGAVEKKFLGELEANEKPAPLPSTTEPITVSSAGLIADRGDLVGFKVKILNTGENRIDSAKPTVTCVNPGVVDAGADIAQAFGKEIIASDIEEFTYMFKILEGAPAGKQLCRVYVQNQVPPNWITPKEFTITVRD